MKYNQSQKDLLFSWGRCTKKGLDREMEKPYIVIKGEELDRLLAKNKTMISTFKFYLTHIKDFIADDYYILLLDHAGILLDCQAIGEDKKDQLEPGSVFEIGVSFAEESCGTNAFSLSMEYGEPVYLLPEQHFSHLLGDWYFFSMPLIIKEGIQGYLGISVTARPLQMEMVAVAKLLEYQLASELKKELKTKGCQQVEGLNERQRKVLSYLARGLTVEATASEMGLSPSTIKYYKRQIFKKFRVGSTIEAVVKAFNYNLISIPDS